MKTIKNILLNTKSFLFILMISTSIVSCETEDNDTEYNMQDTVENDMGVFGDEERRTININAENMRYNPEQITAGPGEKLSIRLINSGTEEHNIEFEFPDGERELDINVQPGGSATLEITAPDKIGTYTFYCPVADHHDKGMEGRLVVE